MMVPHITNVPHRKTTNCGLSASMRKWSRQIGQWAAAVIRDDKCVMVNSMMGYKDGRRPHRGA